MPKNRRSQGVNFKHPYVFQAVSEPIDLTKWRRYGIGTWPIL